MTEAAPSLLHQFRPNEDGAVLQPLRHRDGERIDDAMTIVGGLAREALRISWGPDVTITAAELLARRAAPVLRLSLAGGDAPPTAILKQMWPDEIAAGNPVARNPFFAAEAIAHQFLAEIGAEAGLKPALYAADMRGVLLMEDLGPIHFAEQPTYQEICLPLARALARLHERTRPHVDRHRALCGAAGFVSPRDRKSVV